jgi:adenylate kinase
VNSNKPTRTINFIFGPNGVGKGTLADKLCDQYDFITVSMGDVIREYANSNGHADIQKMIHDGILVSDEIIRLALLEKFETIKDDPRSVIMDGLPRKPSQVAILSELCSKYSINRGWLIVLSCPLEIIEERLEERVIAPNGKSYHLRYNPPPTEFAASELKTRPDDRPEIIIKRYEDYMMYTLACLGDSFFLDCPIGNIDATQSIDKVFSDACWFLSDLTR